MKYLICGMIYLSIVGFAHSTSLYANDGTYLGELSANRFDPNSTSNQFGQYGSQFSPNSINNQFGQYGSRFSPNSVNNPYVVQPIHVQPMQFNNGVYGYGH